jgi:hypothetical protein
VECQDLEGWLFDCASTINPTTCTAVGVACCRAIQPVLEVQRGAPGGLSSARPTFCVWRRVSVSLGVLVALDRPDSGRFPLDDSYSADASNSAPRHPQLSAQRSDTY